ncbi:MAG: site-2 protease family protein [Burkholderiales bacterium]|jgi:Zn-dependent protease|nr:site-2 protease family protein [Burkholderiales bacterium]
MNFDLSNIVALAIPALFAITLHEFAHGFVASKFGDQTARMLGRLTLNPIKHIDPIGTIAVPLGLYLLSGGNFLFGWAKPVPVSGANLRNPARNMRWVAAAGPFANLLMAFFWIFFAVISIKLSPDFSGSFLMKMASFGVIFNVSLMWLNLLPILPLDGGRIVQSLLPWRWAQQYAGFERYGMMILLVLLASGGLSFILTPLIQTTQKYLGAIGSFFL